MSSVAKLFLELVGTQTGEIKGESRVAGFVDQIEIDDWSLNLKQEDIPAAYLLPNSPSKSQGVPSRIEFTKIIDRATTPMLVAMATGDLLTATITLEEVAEDQFGLVMKLTDARLVAYSLDAKDQEKSVSVEETWTFEYREIVIEHRADAGAGTSSFKIPRPPWADKKSPGSSETEKVLSDVAKLAENYSSGELKQMWDRVNVLIKERKDGKDAKDAKGGKSGKAGAAGKSGAGGGEPD